MVARALRGDTSVARAFPGAGTLFALGSVHLLTFLNGRGAPRIARPEPELILFEPSDARRSKLTHYPAPAFVDSLLSRCYNRARMFSFVNKARA